MNAPTRPTQSKLPTLEAPAMSDIAQTTVLDSAHLGDIQGAFGTIRLNDTGARKSWRARMMTLFAIIGPGLIVMIGDNDAGGFSTYGQAGQNYGYSLLWTLLLLIPVLYVNQEMVLRLGAVTGVGHGRLILERFGRFWGAFSVIDLFILNGLTIVTEFIGIDLSLKYLGMPEKVGVAISALLVIAAASTGSFRRFERLAIALCVGSLVLVPLYILAWPSPAQVAVHLVVPQLPKGGLTADLMLMIISIVGTTIAPWQLFFQQSYVIDKRITPRFIRYERADLWIGMVLVMIGAVAVIAVSAHGFIGTKAFGHFVDTQGTALGLEQAFGHLAGVLFAIGVIFAAMLGAAAVSLSTAYAFGDVLSLHHSLHRKPGDARAFFAIYALLIAGAAALVLTPGVPLGMLTNAVQALAGVLLPSATVFLLLLCNDPAVLGPWVNGRGVNLLTGAVIAVLVLLSLVLTAATLFPAITGRQIVMILAAGGALALATALAVGLTRRDSGAIERGNQENWRMPPLATLAPMKMTLLTRMWMVVLRGYLVLAAGLVLWRIALLAIG
jgi:NRAMP (natural resistance-associated macrophage protein)-like metal ion transporter